MEQVIKDLKILRCWKTFQQWLKLAPRGVRVEVEMEESSVVAFFGASSTP